MSRLAARGLARGFTLLEIMAVISIIGILAALILPSIIGARKAAYLSRTKAEFRSIATALEFWINDQGSYPADVNRGLPPGLEQYLAPGTWPAAPWPESVYDWDSWAPADLAYPPSTLTRQISVRFCPLGEPEQCNFPNEPWAANFDYHSSVYYCVSGACRAHASQPMSHPGYCINC
jgi:prepilin-type N-terminal cleavage/methylation domain-containing protein